MKAKKTPLYILLTYVIMQLSAFIFMQPIASILTMLYPDATKTELLNLIRGWTTFTTFFLGFLVVLIFILRDKDFFKKGFIKGKKASIPTAIFWGGLGFFMVFIAQFTASWVEQFVLGIKPGSTNTALLSDIAAAVPIMMLSLVFIGPILEEIVFRRIIFGSLNQTTNFFVASFVSAIIFGLIHMELEHLLVYTATGFVFAFLYNKTKRLLTPIIAHVMLNGFVLLIQLNQTRIMDYIESIQKSTGQ